MREGIEEVAESELMNRSDAMRLVLRAGLEAIGNDTAALNFLLKEALTELLTAVQFHRISHANNAVKWLGMSRKYISRANGATMITQSRMKILIGWGQRELSQ
jgi:hypothetical protein